MDEIAQQDHLQAIFVRDMMAPPLPPDEPYASLLYQTLGPADWISADDEDFDFGDADRSDWTTDLILDAKRLQETVSETPAFASIQQCGIYLATARANLHYLVSRSADSHCSEYKAKTFECIQCLSFAAKMPALRFFKKTIFRHRTILNSIVEMDAESKDEVDYLAIYDIQHINSGYYHQRAGSTGTVNTCSMLVSCP